ncbi:hypothetical protein HYPSUDRAFT_39846 [Hypholoma sublateritium FD-334 SS-4]|uniref:Uncharacterized protein n=1 Tax=Hypholoma sublateritium (strain FD-334 SS-4) TaxID=945553 RepID=A0A0D2N1G0_HYPSF|nr:hypothetical protein HYPSUDRAFT_50031 [Hypholoma sublateritium FD-334 SS-4]KJA23324.1 hypothetical protein HYPSUDRAFT_39846 [Hypholoma sublateritium FD-334 SS-4]
MYYPPPRLLWICAHVIYRPCTACLYSSPIYIPQPALVCATLRRPPTALSSASSKIHLQTQMSPNCGDLQR